MKHTKGAMKAAKIIMGDKEGQFEELIFTTFGTKNLEGLAAIIDDQTAAPDMLEALENLVLPLDKGWKVSDMEQRIASAKAAIRKAKGE